MSLFNFNILVAIIVFLVEALIFISFGKNLFKKTKLLELLKTYILFELLLFLLIFLMPRLNSYIAMIFYILIPVVLLFLSSKIFRIFDWKRLLILFVLFFMILQPLVSINLGKAIALAIDVEMTTEEYEMTVSMMSMFGFMQKPVKWRIIDSVHSGLLGGGMSYNYFSQIIANI